MRRILSLVAVLAVFAACFHVQAVAQPRQSHPGLNAFNTRDLFGAGELLLPTMDAYPLGGIVIGELYRCGDGLPLDEYEAIYWFRRYVRPTDHHQALDQLLAKHPDFPTDDAGVFALYRRLASAPTANTEDFYRLGLVYRDGRGTAKSYDDAQSWFRRAAEKGHDFAQLEMGRMKFFEKEVAEARRWMAMAAEAGNAIAQQFQGDFFAGLDNDPKTAAAWYLKAAEQNYGKAAGSIGLLMVAGRGVEKDRLEGAKWLKLSLTRVTPDREQIYLDALRPLWNFFTEAERAEVDARMGAFIAQVKANGGQRRCGPKP